MAWFVALVLIIFYLLGLLVFHGTKAIYLLLILAILVVVIDFVVGRALSRR